MRTFVLLSVILVLVLCACSKRHGSGDVVDEETFVNYYSDRLVVIEENNLAHSDSLNSRHRLDSLLEAYQITPAQLQATITSYRGDIEKWKEFYDRVNKRLDSLQMKLNFRKS